MRLKSFWRRLVWSGWFWPVMAALFLLTCFVALERASFGPHTERPPEGYRIVRVEKTGRYIYLTPEGKNYVAAPGYRTWRQAVNAAWGMYEHTLSREIMSETNGWTDVTNGEKHDGADENQ